MQEWKWRTEADTRFCMSAKKEVLSLALGIIIAVVRHNKQKCEREVQLLRYRKPVQEDIKQLLIIIGATWANSQVW